LNHRRRYVRYRAQQRRKHFAVLNTSRVDRAGQQSKNLFVESSPQIRPVQSLAAPKKKAENTTEEDTLLY